MAKILLDYFFPITEITPTAAANTAFLKQVCLVVKPIGETPTEVITRCVSPEEVAALTANTEAEQFFDAGLSRVYILPMDDLDMEDVMSGPGIDFFTLIVSSDFSQAEIQATVAVAEVKSKKKVQDIMYTSKVTGIAGDDLTVIYVDDAEAGMETVDVTDTDITVHMKDGVSTAAQIKAAVDADVDAHPLVGLVIDVDDENRAQVDFSPALELEGGVDAVAGSEPGLKIGEFKGVVGLQSVDDEFNASWAVKARYAVFHTTTTTKAKNLCYAFGKMLSNRLNWRNQQYIEMPFADDVDTLGEAESLFDDKVSFVISDSEFSERLSLFAAGSKAIVAPYIIKNLEIDMQSAALSYISGNQPAYSLKEAALLEDELKKVIDLYISRAWITAGTISVSLEEDNFVASGAINIAEPKAMWRVFAELRETL